MRTLVGIDLQKTYPATLRLAQRIRWKDPEWLLVNVVAPMATYSPGIGPMAIPVAEALEALFESGRQATERAKETLGDDSVSTVVVEGGAASMLMRLADEREVDLIIAGSGQAKKGWPWTIGSVSRSLSFAAKQSLLIAKQPSERSGPVHALFATDHSDYAKRALEQLVRWEPGGFSRIDVVSAYEVSDGALSLLKVATDVKLEFGQWMQDHGERECAVAVSLLRRIAGESEVYVREGHPNEVIPTVMRETGAELLILGAQGHGFVERMLIGSISLHQMFAEPYPALILRLPS